MEKNETKVKKGNSYWANENVPLFRNFCSKAQRNESQKGGRQIKICLKVFVANVVVI